MSAVDRFDEQVDGAPTGEADREGLVVAVAERHHAPVSLFEHAECLDDDSTFDAATRHGARDLAVLGDCHGRAGQSWARPLEVDHTRDRHAFALPLPAFEVVEYLFHSSPL